MATQSLTTYVTHGNPDPRRIPLDDPRVHRLPPGPENPDLNFDDYQFQGGRTGHQVVDTVGGGGCTPIPAIRLAVEESQGHRFASAATAENLRKIPRLQMRVFTAFYWGFATHAEIGSALGITRLNSRVLLCRARKHLEALAH